MTRDEAIALAGTLTEYRGNWVADATRLARYVLDGGDANGLAVANARATELQGQRDTLARLIDAIAAAEPDARDQAIAAAMTARKACQ